ncbi:MAG: DEAD/DEAH box helicase [Terrimicrobiaceae bacterium]|nr:DEAD/DEAH box helicase [Terrimicrobiaceae bacterium]
MLTEKFLVSLCGWPVFQEARRIQAAGRISEASFEPPVLKGRVNSDGKAFLSGLKMRNAIDVENLCPCRDSRVRGIICAHAVAVGLEVLKPHVRQTEPAPEKPATPRAGETTTELPKVTMTLEGSLRHVEAELNFEYSRPGISNPTAETRALAELAGAGFEDIKGRATLRGEDAVMKFFAATLPQLRGRWDVREGERFRHVTRDVVRIEPHFAIREASDGWLDFHVHFTAGRDAVLSLQDVQRLLRGGSPTLKLADGRVAVPDAALAGDLEEVLRDCDPAQERGRFRIRSAQRPYLEQSVARWNGTPPVPEQMPDAAELGSLRSVLRSYQIDGARWMLGLARQSSGGLLADEMGLGKTLQTLAMQEAVGGTHLVVCPSSLVWNWRQEATRFRPGLRVVTLAGAGREALFQQVAGADLVVTSYATLRRDLEKYRDVRFATVVLDEAQHIKNPDSQNARAACALDADARFILTGTPLENSIRDLWSLFEFLLPGHLGTRKDFQERYEKPILDGERGATWDRLVRRVQPWMLRRRKADVLSELPPKIEQVVTVEMTAAQKTAYTELQIAARAGIDALRQANSGAARMRVLTALLRLRQAACDLRLLGVESAEPSGKMDALLELLGEAVDGGHRVLVFSQFTAMLDLIEPALNAAGHAFVRLDGSTRDRQAVVERFQGDPTIPVFLISLKAGGAGLNLTAADTVIHFDPWWNPAAEAQATDRAHRIGQENVVTSIKLIARDTVEDRVLDLQTRKRSLLAGLLDAEELPSALTGDDLLAIVD